MAELKKCTTCKEDKPMSEFRNKSKKYEIDGKHRQCKQCMSEYDKRYRNDINRDKFLENSQKRHEFERLLPRLTIKQKEEIRSSFGFKCQITDSYEDIELDHFIPISWGHGGDMSSNLYTLSNQLNDHKGNKNPITFFEELVEKGEIKRENFEQLVILLSINGNLEPDDFINYIFWCEDNKRNSEQIRNDGNKSSIELYIESKSKPYVVSNFINNKKNIEIKTQENSNK